MRHPFSKVACLLLLLQLASAKEAYEVEFAGKLYGVLDRTDHGQATTRTPIAK